MGMTMASVLSSQKTFKKPGACPRETPGSVQNRVLRCSGDESCPKEKKCCTLRHIRMCVAPSPHHFKMADSPVEDGPAVYKHN
ncbi:rCG35422 [Rattus norvegicus]|uniref:RCG35422 n=2 Tax=Boreoeutheria TaxID=1437010 RepID=A6HHI9_RAT|nr:rCG35422 [Rattus norvegicus]